MKARVKRIADATKVRSGGHSDSFCAPEMNLGTITVTPLVEDGQELKEWYVGKGWNFHESWLTFLKKPVKGGRR